MDFMRNLYVTLLLLVVKVYNGSIGSPTQLILIYAGCVLD